MPRMLEGHIGKIGWNIRTECKESIQHIRTNKETTNLLNMIARNIYLRKMHMYQLYQKLNYLTCIVSGIKNPVYDAIDPLNNPIWI
jgi:hypothetical protein